MKSLDKYPLHALLISKNEVNFDALSAHENEVNKKLYELTPINCAIRAPRNDEEKIKIIILLVRLGAKIPSHTLGKETLAKEVIRESNRPLLQFLHENHGMSLDHEKDIALAQSLAKHDIEDYIRSTLSLQPI